VAAVEAGTNSIRVELGCPKLGEECAQLRIGEQSGWLLAHIARPGWLPRLDAEQAAVVALALAGFYKEAGVDLIREQIEASFAPASPAYDVTDEGLVVWPDGDYATVAVYDLQQRPELRPRAAAGEPRGE